MRVLARLVVLAFLATPLAAGEQRFPPDAYGMTNFMLPSGNIACLYVPKGGTAIYEPRGGGPELACDRVEPAYVTVILGPTGPAEVLKEPAEVACCSGPILNYGNHWQEGPFLCTSERTGLTCRRSDGRGFSMARARVAAF